MKSLDYGAVVENKRRHKTETHEEKAKRVCFEGHLACVKINQISEPMSQCPCASIFFIFFSLSNQTILVDGPHGHILLLACIGGGEDHGAVLLPGRTDTQELSSRQWHEKHRPHGNFIGP